MKDATDVRSRRYTKSQDEDNLSKEIIHKLTSTIQEKERQLEIEAALERVRSKAMAMHTCADLSNTASTVFTELRKLGISPFRCGVGILTNEDRKVELYASFNSEHGDSLSLVGWAELRGHPILERIFDAWTNQHDYFPELQGDDIRSYYKALQEGMSLPLPDFDDQEVQYGTFLPFTVGCFYAWSHVKYHEDQLCIMRRFASVIDLTFRRFLELQKSEDNAKLMLKQSVLDRIRADIASMRSVQDMDRIIPLMWTELCTLKVPFIRCGVFIMDDEKQRIQTFLSTPTGKAIAAFHLDYNLPGKFAIMLQHWRDKKRYISHWDYNDFNTIADILVEQGSIGTREQYLSSIPEGGFQLHFLPFRQGMLYVGNCEPLTDEQTDLVQCVAETFSTAYARYEDFKKLELAKVQVERTLADLKQAQQQLIQSEKMASLGVLTAGIAHEIQNPLNFVSNFSEVNSELIAELLMVSKQRQDSDAEELLLALGENQKKILHHAKRADAIVKNMLQHSRSNSGVRESIDLNALVDEFLHLAYHGAKASDTNFKASFHLTVDPSVGKVKMAGQDIGRVILNLVNNAFYAVNEKYQQHIAGYEPRVQLATSREGKEIMISIKDNGNGIPQHIMQKIFQPFFTTKPSGEGTGLGLSLSYDIIKAHGGDIKVESREGEGTVFTVILHAD